MTDDPALFAIVPLPPPGPARDALLREAIAFGGPDEMLRKFFACEATERDLANQLAQTAEVANRVAEVGAHLMDMTEALTVRQDKQRRLDAKRKADQERKAQEEAVRAEAASLRDWLDNNPEPKALPDDGELETKQPVDKERYDPEGTEADQGDLPKELEKGAPSPLGSYAPESKDPHQIAQPIAIEEHA